MASPAPTVPDAATNLVATGRSATEIDLTWTDGTAAAGGYRVERSTDGATFATLATVAGTATAYADTAAATPGQSYQYRVTAVSGSLSSAATAVATATPLLPAFAYTTPSSNPALPAGVDTYTPPVGTQAAAGGTPAVAASTPDAGPDDTLVLAGTGFTATGTYADTRVLVYGQTTAGNGGITTATNQVRSATGLLATIPAGADANAMYLVWPVSGAGVGAPVAVNQAAAQWVGPSTAAAGASASVYGRNLASATGTSYVYLQPTGGGAGTYAAVTGANPYKADFTVPAGLANGTYQVWVHNGHGGAYGWSMSPGPLTVAAAQTYTGTTINVRNPVVLNGVTYPAAVGDGVTDDGLAIARALLSAKPGQTVYVPAGTYSVPNRPFWVPNGVRLLGAGVGATVISMSGSLTSWLGNQFGVQMGSNSRMEGLTLNYAGVGSGANSFVYQRDATGVSYDHVSIDAVAMHPIDLQGSTLTTLTNSTLAGQDVNVIWASQVRIANVTFRMRYDAESAVRVISSTGVSVTGCTAQNYDDSTADPSGWGQGRFLVGELLSESSRDQYFGNNATVNLGSRNEDNSGEQFLMEGVAALWTGAAAGTGGATTVRLANAPATMNIGSDLIVLSGTGVGQHRVVTAYDPTSGTVTVDRPWAVAPDATSSIQSDFTFSDMAFYQNSVSHRTDAYAANDLASVGFEAFTGSYGLVFDGNAVANALSGVQLWSDAYDVPTMFDEVLNNRVTGAGIQGVALHPQQADLTANMTGVIVRGNTIAGAGTWGLNLGTDPTGVIALTVVEHNTVTNAPIGLLVGNDPTTLAYRNTFTAGTAGTASDAVTFNRAGAAMTLVGNAYAGFGSAYAGSVPAGMSAGLSAGTDGVAASVATPAAVVAAPAAATPADAAAAAPAGSGTVAAPVAAVAPTEAAAAEEEGDPADAVTRFQHRRHSRAA